MYDVSTYLARLDEYWRRERRERLGIFDTVPVFGTEHDQVAPEWMDNPYWEIVRRMPWAGRRHTPEPMGLDPWCPILREELVRTFSWSIPSPGDITWLAKMLDGRGVLEVGAGSGYWAWQLSQAGVDVLAWEPRIGGVDNQHVGVVEPYHPLVREGAAGDIGAHSDRALMLIWPTYAAPWAGEALAAHRGDTLVYAGEGAGGCCADDDFFEALDRDWEYVESSPHHPTWWGVRCNLDIYRRAGE